MVAGHICLDIIPEFSSQDKGQTILRPGGLYNVESPKFTTGGAVPNTGLALHRLGFPVNLLGKISQDMFGNEIQGILKREDESLCNHMIIDSSSSTSYTVVINPPGTDRIFLHNAGANDTFNSSDIDDSHLQNVSLFHFGYPPLMKRMYERNGVELSTIFKRLKSIGITTSLDMALPDPASESGKIDWKELLENVLPYVDIFLPSLEELLFMIDRCLLENLKKKEREMGQPMQYFVGQDILESLSKQLLNYGVAIVVIKLGESGLYVRTQSEKNRFSSLSKSITHVEDWIGREMMVPCYKVESVGATGAGDSTIAGFLGGLLKGLPLKEIVNYACAVGAYCVEAVDATSNIPSWEELDKRVSSDWGRMNPVIKKDKFNFESGIFYGPNDSLDPSEGGPKL